MASRVLLVRLGGTIGFLALVLPTLLAAFPVWADDVYGPGELQVGLRPGVPIEQINERYGTSTLESLPPFYLLAAPEGIGEDELLDQLDDDPDIEQVEYTWENETPEATRQMVVTAVGGEIEGYLDQHLVERIHLAEIHQHTTGDGILVAVIDTGVLATHPALADAIAPGGYDFVDQDPDPTDEANGQDDDGDGLTDEAAGHGTMVAGIVHLVAPNARILPIRVLDDEGQGGTFTVARAIRYAIQQGADVVNLSLGLTQDSFVIEHEIDLEDSLSVVITAAAGNLGVEDPAYYPAVYGNVLSVAALDSSDVKADFSNWHDRVAISAPGVGVYAPYHDGQYAIGAGTSFAAPFVAGQCALILALNPSLTVAEVYECVGLGVAGIYDIPGNEVYVDKLGTGRIDGYQTWLNTPAPSSAMDGGLAATAALRVFPNPARAGEAVLLRLDGQAGGSVVGARVHDAVGRLVQTLSIDRDGTVEWDGLDRIGRPVSPGVYFVRMTGCSESSRQRIGARLVLLD